MNKTVLASLIGASATIIASLISLNAGKPLGKNAEQQYIQNEINEALGDVVNIIGDGNNVTIHDLKDFI